MTSDLPYLKDGKVYISQHHKVLIGSSFLLEECPICNEVFDEIFDNIRLENDSLYISYSWLEDNGFVEYLEQIIGKIKKKIRKR